MRLGFNTLQLRKRREAARSYWGSPQIIFVGLKARANEAEKIHGVPEIACNFGEYVHWVSKNTNVFGENIFIPRNRIPSEALLRSIRQARALPWVQMP